MIEVDSEWEAQRLRDEDPAVRRGLCTVEMHPMPMALVRPPDPRS